jgi:hypothetical protein
LKQIKYELKKENLLCSRDIFRDIESSKTLFESLSIPNESNFNGYIKEISHDPFGYLLLSYIQVFFY